MDPKEFSTSALEEKKKQEEQKEAKKQQQKEATRQQKVKNTAAIKEVERKKKEAEADKKKMEEQVVRTKIEKYLKHPRFIQLKKIEFPKPSDSLPKLKEKYNEIIDQLNTTRASYRLTMMLDGTCSVLEKNWRKLPENYQFNLDDISVGKPLNKIIHELFDPILDELLIEYPWLGYSPLPVRVIEATCQCITACHSINTNPQIKKAMALVQQQRNKAPGDEAVL